MVLFNHATREMTAKIVYYGPGLCGKTTNLLVIFDKLDPKNRGKMLSLATKTDRTLFFDLLPVDVGKVGPFQLKIQLYTVPGQVFYNETRKLVLKGADAVVFVADSQASMVSSNRDSFANLLENLEKNQLDPNEIPIVVQYNKRDIPGVLPIEDLQEQLGLDGYPYVEASAVKGEGVMETFKLVSKIAAKTLLAKLQAKPGAKESKKVKVKTPEVVSQPQAIEGASPVESGFVAPFPDAPFETPDQESYEKVEEVSLEQLLEGRERPATFSGNVALPSIDEPVEEVESLEEASLLPHAIPEEPAPIVTPHEFSPEVASSSTSNAELQSLRNDLEELKREQQRLRSALMDIGEVIMRLTSSEH